MFRFQSFHMYGIIGSALLVGAFVVQIIKRLQWKTIDGEAIIFKDKDRRVARYLGGGIIFGLGWALSGACPGPMYTLLGNDFVVFIIVLSSPTLGTYVYGLVRDKLPH